MLKKFPALSSRDIKLFLTGQIISLSGTWMHSVAQGWLVYSITKSAFWLGIVAACSSLPIFLFSLFGGFIADKYPKKKILVITQILSIFPAFTMGVLTDLQIIKVWHIAMLAATLGIINAFDIPTRQSFLGEIADKKHIISAIGLNSAVFNTARIIGPLSAGFIIEHFTLSTCFYLNALSFIPIAIIVSLFKNNVLARNSKEKMFDDIMYGLKHVKNDKYILPIISLIALFSLFGIPFVSVLPLITAEVLMKSAGGLSVLIAASGLGSLIGALTLAMKSDVKHKHKFLSFAAVIFCISLSVISFSKNFYTTMVFMFSAGWGIVSCLAAGNSFIQQSAPDTLRGRIMSLYTFAFLGLMPIGNSIVGTISEVLGAMDALKILSIICIIGTLKFIKSYKDKNVIACN